jgi:RNA polymerase primary sigma factor
VGVKEALRADRAVQPVASYAEGGDDPTVQPVADDADDAGAVVARADAVGAVAAALRVLPYRQREILKLRTGVGDGWRYDLTACGLIFGLSRERVRQLYERAMAALRQPGVMELLAQHQ